ncbi:WGxxGxxG family protein [Paenibacillus herberti]|uniref:MYXO-CTERM domain-containing protein n=1 Tax=Paenibacillus herberti TaxID=1619309 RepID=A0A229P176_9BACL|nr:WGxxGxxG family protein [Paenibacillus herberti]OXM15781.1 hypothetical protein CGZ75_03420 [Paenibacillus herberti]
MKKIVMTLVLALGLAFSSYAPAFAHNTGMNGNLEQNMNTNTTSSMNANSYHAQSVDNNEKKSNWGWLGLLGLVGLAGLRNRNPERH